jgi:glycosyltransferase involved in cell wall biosynthesis
MSRKILFLVPYPLNESPSQRFRFEQYFEILRSNGYEFKVQSFLDVRNWKIFFKSGNGFRKLLCLITGYGRRLKSLFTAWRYDYIFIHREATPLGPPVIEWILAKVLRSKLIYDFDDAIWMTDRKHEPFYLRLLKWRSKVKQICSWSYRVSCGNSYLAAYASQYNARVVYNPTTIDTEHWHNPELYPIRKNKYNITIGWTGSHTTLKYLNTAEPVLQRIAKNFPTVQFLVIADRAPELALSGLTFIPWDSQTEVQDLLLLDIGIMPLPDDEWAKGKCGFKALQYMALKIPAVVSPVGVNSTIIDHNSNGFLADSQESWYQHLSLLITDEALRRAIGNAARQKVIDQYSVLSNASNFLSLFA